MSIDRFCLCCVCVYVCVFRSVLLYVWRCTCVIQNYWIFWYVFHILQPKKFFFFSWSAVSLCRCPRLSVGFQDLGLLVPVAGCWSIYRRCMFLLLVIVSSVSAPVPFILDMSINFKIKSLTGSGAETFVRI